MILPESAFNSSAAVEAPKLMARARQCRLARFSPAIVFALLAFFCFFPPGHLAHAAEPDQDDPDTELKSFKVADGYEVHLFASEKEGIVKPVQMRWDPRGRLWVSCIPSYPQLKPEEQPDDRIVILADTDGKSVANESKVFARGLSLPLGLELGHGGLYVSNGTDLLHLKSSTGDDKADQTTVILRGFFTGDSHQNINSFVWGPGGELMFCQGLHAFSQVETPWGIERLEKAGVWRLRPRTLRLESFLGLDRGPQNPWGIVFDDWGQPIMVAGNGQGIYYLLPSLIGADHFLDPRQIWDRQNIKLCGVDIIGTRALPDAVQGMMVAGSILDNSVYLFKLEENGSGFKVRQFTPLIVSSHSSFRVVDAKVGPDGAIYIADWYNPIIGHYQASLRHPDRDHTHGRIWRITAKDRASVARPPLTALAVSELIDQLRSSERWVRYQARRLLAEKPPAEISTQVQQWVKHLNPVDPRYEHNLLEALGIVEEQELVDEELLKRLLRASDPRARAYATGVIGHWHDRLPDALDLLAIQAADESPRVRLEAVVAAAQIPSARSMEVAASAADRPMDEFLDNALTQAVHALKPYWKPALDAGQLSFGGSSARLAFVSKADGTADVVQTLLKRVISGRTGDADHDNSLVLVAGIGSQAELCKVIADPSLRYNPGVNFALANKVFEALANHARQQNVVPAGQLEETLRPWLMQSEESSRQAALGLAGAWKVAALRALIQGIASDRSLSISTRQAALQSLGALGGAESVTVLAQVADSDEPPQVRVGAIAALARVDLQRAAGAAAGTLPKLKESRDIADVVNALLSRQNGAEALAQALSATSLPPDVAKLALRSMSAAGRQDTALWERLSAAAGIASTRRPYNVQLVQSIVAEVMASGNPSAGEAVFRSQMINCLSCHSVGGAGGHVGPDLATIGTAMPVELVVESLLWPNKQVKEGYMATLVETTSGDVQQGYVASDTKEELVLRDPVTDRVYRFPSRQIKRRKEIGSLMPDGVTDGLTQAELRDLVRFLCELGKPGPYRVPSMAVVRVWEVMPEPPAPFNGLVAEKVPDTLPSTHAILWQGRYAKVNGELPAAEFPPSGQGTFAWIRFKFDVVSPGKFTFALNSVKGVMAWLDERSIGPLNSMQLDLTAGKHVLSFAVDTSRRGATGISCTVQPATSGAEIHLATSIQNQLDAGQ